jgi:glycosyltransferase involved in cell wall biosynthesis
MPQISVIVPTYNRARYVRETVESILRQDYQDFELIIVDDGSTDNTREVIQNIGDTRIKYIYQENQGVSGALNTGILAAKSEYVGFIASDNMMIEHGLGKVVEFLDRYPDAGFCYGQIYTIDGNGTLTRSKSIRGPKTTRVTSGKDEIVKLILGEHSIDCFAARRACFDKVGLYKTSLRMSEDWDMLIRLTAKYNVGHIAEPLGLIRNHPQSMTAKASVDIVKKSHEAVLESVFNDPELGSLYGYLQKKAYFGFYCLLARVANRTGQKGTGVLLLGKAIKSSPGMLFSKRGVYNILQSSKSFLPRWLSKSISRSLIKFKMR